MIRQLGFNEVDKIAASALKFIEKTGYQYGFDLNHFLSTQRKGMMNGNLVAFVEEKNNEIISGVGFAIVDDLYSPGKIMSETWWYGEGAGGLRVIKFAEKFATRARIKQIVMASTKFNEDRNAELYKRLGYERDSSTYRKELNERN